MNEDDRLADVKTSDLEYVINEYIHHKRNRKILRDHFCDGATYEELAEEHQLHVNTIKKIIYKNEWKIFKHLDVKA